MWMELANILSEWLGNPEKGNLRELKSTLTPPPPRLEAYAFGASLGNRSVS